jgi:diamine N-acetyltransferase
MAIVDNNSGTACGFLDVTDLDAIHRRAQIGIVLLPEAQGKGIATKALDEAAMYALQQGLHQLFAVVASDNLKARKLFLRSSYLETTVLPQWLYVDGKFTDAILYQRILEK